MSEQKPSNMVNIGGLWLNRTKETNEIYFSGYLNGAKLLIFKNRFKETENQPDYIMNVVSPDKKADSPANALEAELNGESTPSAPSDADKEIPF